MNALDQALADARRNAQLNGDDLYTDNLEDIANPELNIGQYQDFDARLNSTSPNTYEPQPLPQRQVEQLSQELRGRAYVAIDPERNNLTLDSIDYKLGEITSAVMYTHKEAELTKLRLDALADMIAEVSTTIQKAAQSMPQSSLDHRSLDQWNDTQLINELVERENSLMPFYFELLKRIPQELQPHVDASMNGKYQSLAVLSKLCAALSYVQQPQPPLVQRQPIPEAELQRLEAMTQSERNDFAQRMNQPQSRPFSELAAEHVRNNPHPSPFTPYQTIPPQNRA